MCPTIQMYGGPLQSLNVLKEHYRRTDSLYYARYWARGVRYIAEGFLFFNPCPMQRSIKPTPRHYTIQSCIGNVRT